MYDLIVIGAGPGGYEAALHAGHMGKKVLLIEKKYIGGTCLNVGCIPTKTFLHSAHIYHNAKDGEVFGVKAEKVSFDMPAVKARKEQMVSQLIGGVEGMLKAAKVETVMGQAVITAMGKVTVDGTEYEGSNILIATGSRPAQPPIPGADSAKVLDSTGILELDAIPSKLAVIGAGVIGIEFASFFASVGAEVTVIEMLDRICPGMDGEIAKTLGRELKKQGVNIILKAKVTGINGADVTYEKKDKEETVSADTVLMAVGRSLNLDGVGLDEMKIDYDKSGIKVDDQGRTNIAGIWACGDVTGRCLLAHSATREGQVSVNAMFGAQDRMSYRAMPAVVYSYPEAAGVGLTEEAAKEKGIAYTIAKKPLMAAGRYQVEQAGKSTGLCKVLLSDDAHRQVLGVHMIGSSCSEMIWGASALIENEMRAVDVAQMILPHPTVSEVIKETIIH